MSSRRRDSLHVRFIGSLRGRQPTMPHCLPPKSSFAATPFRPQRGLLRVRRFMSATNSSTDDTSHGADRRSVIALLPRRHLSFTSQGDACGMTSGRPDANAVTRDIAQLLAELDNRADLRGADAVHATQRAGAANLADYLTLRPHDLRDVQVDLAH